MPARQFYLFQAPALKATKGFGGFLQEIGTVSTYSPENNLAGPLCVANARKGFGIFLQDFAPARKLDLQNKLVESPRAEVMRLGFGISLQEIACFFKFNLQNGLAGLLRVAALRKGFGSFFQESAPVRKVGHQIGLAVPLHATANRRGFGVFFREIASVRTVVHQKAFGVACVVRQVCAAMRMGTFASLMGVRVGEASNPGPWHIEVRNVVSADKHVLDLSGDPSCVAWTETSAAQGPLKSYTDGLELLRATSCTQRPLTIDRAGLVARGGGLHRSVPWCAHALTPKAFIRYGIQQCGNHPESQILSFSLTRAKYAL